MDELFTVTELAQIYHVAPGTVHYWISMDRIQGVPHGRGKRYPVGEIQKAYNKRHPEAAAIAA